MVSINMIIKSNNNENNTPPPPLQLHHRTGDTSVYICPSCKIPTIIWERNMQGQTGTHDYLSPECDACGYPILKELWNELLWGPDSEANKIKSETDHG